MILLSILKINKCILKRNKCVKYKAKMKRRTAIETAIHEVHGTES